MEGFFFLMLKEKERPQERSPHSAGRAEEKKRKNRQAWKSLRYIWKRFVFLTKKTTVKSSGNLAAVCHNAWKLFWFYINLDKNELDSEKVNLKKSIFVQKMSTKSVMTIKSSQNGVKICFRWSHLIYVIRQLSQFRSGIRISKVTNHTQCSTMKNVCSLVIKIFTGFFWMKNHLAIQM